MLRLGAALLLIVLVAIPLAVLPAAPVTWLIAGALGVGGAGVAGLSVGLVVTGGTLALIAYALALVLARPGVDVLAALLVGAALTLLPVLVHFAERTRGAHLGAGVVTGQLRQWLGGVMAGGVAALVLGAGAVALGTGLAGATLPVIVIAGVVGAALAVAGVVALVR